MKDMKNIIETIENQLQKQKDDIFVKDLIIEDLKNQLEACKKELAKYQVAENNTEFERECAE